MIIKIKWLAWMTLGQVVAIPFSLGCALVLGIKWWWDFMDKTFWDEQARNRFKIEYNHYEERNQ